MKPAAPVAQKAPAPAPAAPALGTGRPLRLVVIDDEPLWLDLLRRALESTGFEVAAVFTSGQAAIDHWPDGASLALVDVELGAGGPHGFEVVRRLRKDRPELKVVFLTSVVDPWMIDAAAGSTVAGTSYLLKGGVADVRQLERVLNATCAGELIVDSHVLQAMRGDGPISGLTPAQARVMRLVATGWSNAQIAEELGMSVKTVEATVTRIARQFGVESDRNVRVACVTGLSFVNRSGSFQRRTVQRPRYPVLSPTGRGRARAACANKIGRAHV